MEITVERCRVEPGDEGGLSLRLEIASGSGAKAWGRACHRAEAGAADRLAPLAAAMEGCSALARHPLLEAGGFTRLDAGRRAAVGALECARLDALSRFHNMPLSSWMGGALRRSLALAMAFPLPAEPGRLVESPALRRCKRIVFSSGEQDMARLVDRLAALRRRLGEGCEIALRLAGQFRPDELAPLLAANGALRLAFVADPCDDAAASCLALRRALPPLALTAHRYDLPELARAATEGGPLLLLVDPIAAGGIEASRALASLASLTGLEIAFLAESGSWSLCLAAHLAACFAAATAPLIFEGDMAAIGGIEDGMIELGIDPGTDWISEPIALGAPMAAGA